MITHLKIKDFAIIHNLEISLCSGMTVLTGETGSGKSILIDALSLALGERSEARWIRPGSLRAEIVATLNIAELPSAQEWLTQHELDDPELFPDCLIRRTISEGGRSQAYINGHNVPLQLLRELASNIIDIHGQHAHHLLLKPEMHRALLDSFGKHHVECKNVKRAYHEWKDLHALLIEQKKRAHTNDAQCALLRYQVKELDDLNFIDGEWEQINEEYDKLSHGEELINSCETLLYQWQDNDKAAIIPQLYRAISVLDDISAISPAQKNTRELVNQSMIYLQEAANELQNYRDTLELDPQRLQVVQTRVNQLHAMARKYQVAPENLASHHQTLRDTLANMEANADIEALQLQHDAALAFYQKAAQILSNARKNTATQLAQKISAHMPSLGMPGGSFTIQLSPLEHQHVNEHGAEAITFMVSANPGHPPQPLHKIASGGELSRISLAIQVTTVHNRTIPIIVFDEVDVGIGGGTAEIVGQLLRRLGSEAQVLCITHLPQVAAYAHQHIQISKHHENDATYAQLKTLTFDERVHEVARMLGGLKLTEQTLAHAREMLIKEEISCA